MRKLLFLGLLMSLSLAACRLDNFLYNPKETTEYQLDNTDFDPRFYLDSTYDISNSLVHLMSLPSGPENDRETIYAVYIGDTNRISQDTIILYCHGNAGNLDYYWARAKLLANVGGKNRFGVFYMDYRGYGRSTGKPTETGMYYDVDACMQWLKNKGLTSDRLVMKGFSLGSAPATELTANARTLQPSKLILEAPFASAEFMTQDAAKLSLPGSFFTNLEIDNAEEIKKIQEPFLWFHGIADDYIGIQHGELVSQNYQGTRKVEYRIPGGGHSTVPGVMGVDLYSKAIRDFIIN